MNAYAAREIRKHEAIIRSCNAELQSLKNEPQDNPEVIEDRAYLKMRIEEATRIIAAYNSDEYRRQVEADDLDMLTYG